MDWNKLIEKPEGYADQMVKVSVELPAPVWDSIQTQLAVLDKACQEQGQPPLSTSEGIAAMHCMAGFVLEWVGTGEATGELMSWPMQIKGQPFRLVALAVKEFPEVGQE